MAISMNRGIVKKQIHGSVLSKQGETKWMKSPAIGVDPNNPFKSCSSCGPVKDPALTVKQMRMQVRKTKRGG